MSVVFIEAFVAAALLTRILSKVDLYNLRGMTSELGPLGKIVNGTLNLLEKAIR